MDTQPHFYRPKGSPRSSSAGDNRSHVYDSYGKSFRPTNTTGRSLRATIDRARGKSLEDRCKSVPGIPQEGADLNHDGMVRRPCNTSLVSSPTQPESPTRYHSQPFQRSSTLTHNLSVGAPGMTATANFRVKIRPNGDRADVKPPDPLPKG